jgi:Zn-dependent alcohol dehydrogenase
VKSLAAILEKSGRELIIDEIDLPENLKSGQVLVKVITSGICGAQVNEINAVKGPDQFLPHLLGHEGFCEVLDVGPDVSTIRVGDNAIMHWRPGLGIQSETPSYRWKNRALNAGWVTTFNQFAIVSENRLTEILPGGVSKEILPLLGCALTTAFGVIEREAKIAPEDSVLIFGAGGVGLTMIKVLNGMKLKDICVLDITKEKLQLAKKFGATKVIQFNDKASTSNQIKQYFLPGLPRIAIDTTGDVRCIELAYELTCSDGTALLVGVPKLGHNASIYTLPLHFGKRLIGSKGGDSNPHTDIPILVEKLKTKELNFDDFPTHKYSLLKINDALADLREGRTGRMIIDFDMQ